jgi:hypothetical protein
MLTVYRRCSSDREKKYGDAAVMVWQETVNLPTSVTIGSIPIISTKFRSVRIEVITVDCLSTYASSILAQTAKLNATVAQRKSRKLIISWSGCRNSPVAPSFVRVLARESHAV